MRAYVIIPTVPQEHTTARKLRGGRSPSMIQEARLTKKSFHKLQTITTTNTTYREPVNTSTCISNVSLKTPVFNIHIYA